jgi:hypothetical protein
MDDFYILGEGSFAIVVGPFKYNDINQSGLFQKKIKPNDAYFVIKIYKKTPQETYEQLIKKQDLYTKLEKKSKNSSIIFPSTTSFVLGKNIINRFPFVRQYLDENNLYQLELERYGGKSLDNYIFKKENTFSMRDFLKIWNSIPNILDDSYHILFDNNLIMTDIKIENMVVSQDMVLRLIDVDINPNKKTPRVITALITDLPPQYFSKEWWHPNDQSYRKKTETNYTKKYLETKKKEKKIIGSILDFIHSRHDPSFFIKEQQMTQDTTKFQRMFFVMYPLFFMIILLFVYNCVNVKTDGDKIRLKKIVSFCLEILQKRGRFSDSFTYKSFQHFIWTIKSL